MEKFFTKLANVTSHLAGKYYTFITAIVIILIWAITGPIFKYSDTWQLIINTGTTIITFLMVFLIQNTQNRDNLAIHAKLDEIIECTEGAHNQLKFLEEKDEKTILKVRETKREKSS